MLTMLGRRFAGLFVAVSMIVAGSASAQFPTQLPAGPGFGGPGYRPGPPPPGQIPGYPGNPGFHYPPPMYRPPYPGPRPMPAPLPAPVPAPLPAPVVPPVVGGPAPIAPPAPAPVAGGTYNACSKRYEEAFGPVKQPNHSPMMKHWECLNQLTGDYVKELKGLTNLQVTDLQFTQAVAWGNPSILWSAEAIANRKMIIAVSWATAMNQNAFAAWQEFKKEKNICDYGCTQTFMNTLFTMTNTMFTTRDFDWYMRWQYDMSNWGTGGADIRNGAYQAAMGHLDALKQLAQQIRHELRVIEFAPVVQEGFRMFTAAVPGLPWVAGQPFCAYAYGTPYFGQAFFPFHTVPNVGRVFVPQPIFPGLAQEFLPPGYVAPLMPNQYFANNYTTILNTNVQAVPAQAGDTYISNNEWVQQQNGYFRQNPVQNPVQPSVGYNEYAQGRFNANMQRYEGLNQEQRQQMGPLEYPNYQLQGMPQAAPGQQRYQGAPSNNGLPPVPEYQPQGTVTGRSTGPAQVAPAQTAPNSNSGTSAEWDWGGQP